MMVLSNEVAIDIAGTAADYNVDADDLAQLYGYGKRCWPMMAEHFGKNPSAEEYFEREYPAFIISGHPDMRSGPGMEVGVIGDWKSGRVEYDARWQLYGGSLDKGERRGVIVWLRETWSGEPFEVIEIPPEQEIIGRLTEQVAKMQAGECTTGPHCNSMYCERQHECGAYQEYVMSAVTALVTLDEGETLPALEVVSRGYNAWKAYRELSKRYEGLMNQVLDEHGEFYPEDGKKVMRTTRKVKSFDPKLARTIMKNLGIADVDSCFKVSASAFAKAVKQTAAKGKQGAALTDALETMEEAGALHYVTQKTRREMRT
jgi:hypothetical protein